MLSPCSFTPHKAIGRYYLPHCTEERLALKVKFLARSHTAREEWNDDFISDDEDIMGGSLGEKDISFCALVEPTKFTDLYQDGTAAS